MWVNLQKPQSFPTLKKGQNHKNKFELGVIQWQEGEIGHHNGKWQWKQLL